MDLDNKKSKKEGFGWFDIIYIIELYFLKLLKNI